MPARAGDAVGERRPQRVPDHEDGRLVEAIKPAEQVKHSIEERKVAQLAQRFTLLKPGEPAMGIAQAFWINEHGWP